MLVPAAHQPLGCGPMGAAKHSSHTQLGGHLNLPGTQDRLGVIIASLLPPSDDTLAQFYPH
jgi:hypothetical protein